MRAPSRSAEAPRRLFVAREGGASVFCAEGPRLRGTAEVFYTVTRRGLNGELVTKTVRKPARPTRQVPHKGTTATLEIPRAARVNAKLVMDAPPATMAAASPHSSSEKDAGREPLNILPAFVLASPVLAAGTVVEAAREPFVEKDPIGALEKRGITLGVSRAAALGILRREAEVLADGIRVGPGWELRDRSAWLEFQNDRLTGVYTGDFYPMGR